MGNCTALPFTQNRRQGNANTNLINTDKNAKKQEGYGNPPWNTVGTKFKKRIIPLDRGGFVTRRTKHQEISDVTGWLVSSSAFSSSTQSRKQQCMAAKGR